MKEPKEPYVGIGARIKICREQAQITQEKLAELISVTPQYLSDLERGITGTSIPTIIRICNVLNASADYILLNKTKDNKYASVLIERLQNTPPKKLKIIESGINNMYEAINFVSENDE